MITVTYNPSERLLALRFEYDQRTVALVKTIPGRLFDPKRKFWTVPLDSWAAIDKTPFNASYSAEALAAVEDAIRERVELENLAGPEHIISAERLPFEAGKIFSELPLLPFQRTGAGFLAAGRSVLLADEPGLGKTFQASAAAVARGLKRVLVLCPASLKYSWSAELAKWFPAVGPQSMTTVVVDGNAKERAQQWSASKANAGPTYFIANYELLLRDLDAILAAGPWDAIICDEATRIANSRAKTVKALKKIPARYRWALTGTPVSNSPEDLWGIFDWLRPGMLGTFLQFRDRHGVLDYWKNITSWRDLDVIARATAPFILRRTKEMELRELPPKTSVIVPVHLSAHERKVYKAVQSQLLAMIGGAKGLAEGVDPKTLAMMPVKMLRLKQVTGDWRFVVRQTPEEFGSTIATQQEDPSKLAALNDILEDLLASNRRAIVFTQFAKIANMLKTEARGSTAVLDGSLTAQQRDDVIEHFQAGRANVLIMTEAGAYGLNLQCASAVIHYDLPWSIAKMRQREDRAWRMGQQLPVTVYTLQAVGTVDEYVAKVLHTKAGYEQTLLNADQATGETTIEAQPTLGADAVEALLTQ